MMKPDERERIADLIVSKHFDGAMAFAAQLADERGMDRDEAMSAAGVALTRASRSFNPDRMRLEDSWKWVVARIKTAFIDLVGRRHPQFGDTRKLRDVPLPKFGSMPENAADWLGMEDCPQTVVCEQTANSRTRIDLRAAARLVPCSAWLVLDICRQGPISGVAYGTTRDDSKRGTWEILVPDGIREIRKLAAGRLRALAAKRKAEAEKAIEHAKRLEAIR